MYKSKKKKKKKKTCVKHDTPIGVKAADGELKKNDQHSVIDFTIQSTKGEPDDP